MAKISSHNQHETLFTARPWGTRVPGSAPPRARQVCQKVESPQGGSTVFSALENIKEPPSPPTAFNLMLLASRPADVVGIMVIIKIMMVTESLVIISIIWLDGGKMQIMAQVFLTRGAPAFMPNTIQAQVLVVLSKLGCQGPGLSVFSLSSLCPSVGWSDVV